MTHKGIKDIDWGIRPLFSKLFNSRWKSRRTLPSRRKHPSQTVAVIYRYWRKDAKTGGAGNSNHLLFNAKMHVIEKKRQPVHVQHI